MNILTQNFIRAGFVAGVLIGLTSCALRPQVESLNASQPGTDITFIKGYAGTGLGVASTQIYSLSADGTCATLKLAAVFGSLTAREQMLRITAGKPVYIHAATVFSSTASVSMIYGAGPVANVAHNYCRMGAVFVPETGHSYSVRQQSRFGVAECPIEIVDDATGSIVPDVKPAQELNTCGEGRAGPQISDGMIVGSN